MAPPLAPGDIVLYRGSGLVGLAIRLFEQAPVAHAAIVASDARTVIAAEFGGVRRESLPDLDAHGRRWWRLAAPPRLGLLAAQTAEMYLGAPYNLLDYLGIVLRGLGAPLPLATFPARLARRAVICSSLAAACWRAVGAEICGTTPTVLITPADLFLELASRGETV